MAASDRATARVLTVGVGLTCLASAIWLARSPRAATRALRLPKSRTLGRAIAARDLMVGVMLLVPALQRRALAVRAASDALDAALMTGELVRGDRPATARLFIAGALGLSGLAQVLRSQLGEEPHERRRSAHPHAVLGRIH